MEDSTHIRTAGGRLAAERSIWYGTAHGFRKRGV